MARSRCYRTPEGRTRDIGDSRGRYMSDEIPVYLIVAGLGFLIGGGFGFIAWRGQFCVAGSVLSLVAGGDARGLRAIALASATALVLSQLFFAVDLIDLDRSIYRTAQLHWAGAILGGFAFGYGMILANGCGAGSLVRLGGGDLRSLIVLLFLAIFGYMTLRGLTGIPRVMFERFLDIDLAAVGIATQGVDHFAAALTGADADVLRWPIVLTLVVGLTGYGFRDAGFRASRRHIFSGLGVGVCISLGWLATGIVGADEFDPVRLASLTYVAPVANTLQYLMTYTGAALDFGIGTVVGVFLGSLVAAITDGGLRLQYVDGDRDLVDAMIGGALMGVGGVFAFGCSIGNGLTGVSTLSLGAFIAWGAILAGAIMAARKRFRIDD